MKRLTRLLWTVACVIGMAWPGSAAIATEDLPSYIVTTTGQGADPLADVPGKRHLGGRSFVTRLSTAAAERLSKRPGVGAVELDAPVRATLLPNDPCLAGCGTTNQWYVRSIGVPSAWDASRGTGITIAVLDTGVDFTHADLSTKMAGPEIDVTGLFDGPGTHGTQVAGLAAAATNNSIGVAGIGWDARILSVKVLSATGMGTMSSVVNGIYAAVAGGARVINLSLSGPNTLALAEAVNHATQKHAVVVAAAGNESSDQPAYPAALPAAISVGASTSSDRKASFSNFGSWVDVFAPGVSLVTTYPGGSYSGFSGTSAAAPVVAGVAALMLSRNPGATPAAVEIALKETSVPLIDGYGPKVQAAMAVGTIFGSFEPYAGFNGGVRVALADFDNDGAVDVLTGAGPGGGPHVKVTSGSGDVLCSFFAYDLGFRGGVDVATGDLDADGIPEIITGAGRGGGPHVRAFHCDGTLLTGFFAYPIGFSGGVNVASGDTDGDGDDEIIAGAGPGGGPHVRVFRGDGTLISGFFPFAIGFTGGVDVAGVDQDGDGDDEIIAGAGPGGGPHVKVSTAEGLDLASFFPYDLRFSGGVRVAGADLDGDGQEEVITGAGPGGGPHVGIFRSGAAAYAFFPFNIGFDGGVDVAGHGAVIASGTSSKDSLVRLRTLSL